MLEIVQVISDYLLANKIELIGFLFGVACVWLNLKENVWAWPTGIISVFFLIFVYHEKNLIGDYILHIIYLILGIFGWYNWLKGGKKQKRLSISFSKRKELIALAVVGVCSTLLFGYYLDNYTEDTIPYWDSFTTCFSLVAQYQLTKKKIENWILWIVVDVICVPLYYHKEMYLTSFLYFIYLFLATAGYFNWKKLFEKQELSEQDWSDLEKVQWKSNTK